jgi:hypothetical protein
MLIFVTSASAINGNGYGALLAFKPDGTLIVRLMLYRYPAWSGKLFDVVDGPRNDLSQRLDQRAFGT